MKNLLSAIALIAMTPLVYAGGNYMSDSQGNSMSSAKSSSGVHFYGRLYIGYDSTVGDTARLDDGGNKSRLGLKVRSGNIVGNLEYKYDIGDGTSGAGNNCGTNNENGCQTFALHIGNLGFMTPLGYIGAGTYEAPYKTMGQFDTNIDTALALNEHGGFSQGQGGIAGNFEGALAYHTMVGPLEIGYMYAATDNTANDLTNTDRGDYSLGVTAKDLFLSGLTLGYARYHDDEVAGAPEENNDKIDHQRDDHKKVRNYVDFFDKRIVALASDKDNIDKLTRFFKTKYELVEPSKPGFIVEHSSNIYILDKNLQVKKIIPNGIPSDEITVMLRRYL